MSEKLKHISIQKVEDAIPGHSWECLGGGPSIQMSVLCVIFQFGKEKYELMETLEEYVVATAAASHGDL